jgi:membrane associated rhomboid family serine protease
VGVSHRLVRSPHGWELVVPASEGETAAHELALWEKENLHWPPPKVHWAPRSAGWTGAMVYAVVIMAFHLAPRLPARFFSGNGGVGGAVGWRRTLLESGRGDAERLLDGEWWRAVTGLFLHGDLGHLAGNLAFGILFGVLVAQALGSGLAWFAILLTGVFGNLVNALIHEFWVEGPTHLSIGASTAVFGAVGLLTGFSRRRGIGTAATRWGPVLAGLVLLAYLGMGGQDTDLLAHITGFATGLLLGTLTAGPSLGALLERHQRLWAVLALALPALAWLRALLG